MPSPKNTFEGTKRLMATLGRMPPKPHEEMKINKTSEKKVVSLKSRRARVKKKSS